MDEKPLMSEQQNDFSSEKVAESVSTEVIYSREIISSPQLHEEETKETNGTFPGTTSTPKLKRKVQLVKQKFRTTPTKKYISNCKQIISIYETFMIATLEHHGIKISYRKGSVGDSEMLVDQMKVLMQWFPSEIERWKCKYEEKEKSDRLNEERMEKMFEKCKPNITIYENCFHKQSGIYNMMDLQDTPLKESNPQLTDIHTQGSIYHEAINSPFSEHNNTTIQTAENQSTGSITYLENHPTEYVWNTSSEGHSSESESINSLENHPTECETKEYANKAESLSVHSAKATVVQQPKGVVFDKNISPTTEDQNIDDIAESSTSSNVERCLICIDALNETLNLRNTELFSLKRLNETLNQRNAEMSLLKRLYEMIIQEIEPKIDELLELTKSKSKTFSSSSKRKEQEKLLLEIKRWLQSLIPQMETNTSRCDLMEITKQAVSSIRVREDFYPLNRDSLPEDAKPLHTWMSVKYGHKPQLLQKFLHGPSEEGFVPNENEKLDIYAMFLVTWVKNNEENTPEQLMEIFNQLDDSLSRGDETMPRHEEDSSQNL